MLLKKGKEFHKKKNDYKMSYLLLLSFSTLQAGKICHVAIMPVFVCIRSIDGRWIMIANNIQPLK